MSTEVPTSNSIHQTLNGVQPMIGRALDQASELAHRSADALRDRARNASDSTASYIRAEPVKSVLMAAAGGAALVAVISFFARSRRQG